MSKKGIKKLYSLLNFIVYQLLVLIELQKRFKTKIYLEDISRKTIAN